MSLILTGGIGNISDALVADSANKQTINNSQTTLVDSVESAIAAQWFVTVVDTVSNNRCSYIVTATKRSPSVASYSIYNVIGNTSVKGIPSVSSNGNGDLELYITNNMPNNIDCFILQLWRHEE
jgi:hypothetical protein